MDMNHKRITITPAELDAITGNDDPLACILTPEQIERAMFELALDAYSSILIAFERRTKSAHPIGDLFHAITKTATLALAAAISDGEPGDNRAGLIRLTRELFNESLDSNLRFFENEKHKLEFVAAAAPADPRARRQRAHAQAGRIHRRPG